MLWKAERFSWSVTTLPHRLPEEGPFDERIKQAELVVSRAARAPAAETFVGLPS